MARSTSLILMLVGLFGLAFTARAQSPENMRLQLTRIMDPTGFEKPMTSATSVIPADWTTKGGVIWRTGMDCNMGYTMDWTATSPDGEAMIRMLPTASWRYNNQGMPNGQGCIPGAFNSAEDYVRGFVTQLDNPQIISVERDPATSRLLSQPPFSYEFQGDPYSKNWWDAASVTFDYEHEGKAYTASMILFTMHNYTLSGHSFGMGQPLEMGYGVAASQILMAAPKDTFAEHVPAFLLFMKNYQTDPQWQKRINAYLESIRPPNRPRQPDTSSIVSDTYDEISDMSMESWRKRNGMTDTGQRETSEWIRGVETYNADTPTGQVELPLGYDRAFQMDDGSFVVTNDRFFDPMSGQELNATQ